MYITYFRDVQKLKHLYLRPCSIAIYGMFYLYFLRLFRPFSGLQIWSINYALHFGSVKIHKIVYIGVYLVLTYIEKVFSTVCYFLSYFYWSVNESRHFFWHAQKLSQGFYFWGLLVLSVNWSSHFLVTFCWSVNCMCWVFDFADVQKLKH